MRPLMEFNYFSAYIEVRPAEGFDPSPLFAPGQTPGITGWSDLRSLVTHFTEDIRAILRAIIEARAYDAPRMIYLGEEDPIGVDDAGTAVHELALTVTFAVKGRNDVTVLITGITPGDYTEEAAA